MAEMLATLPWLNANNLKLYIYITIDLGHDIPWLRQIINLCSFEFEFENLVFFPQQGL
jgi:hypothetical protein